MKTALSSLLAMAALLLFASTSHGEDLVNVSGASGIALSGYDPVAFFKAKKPVHGDPSITATYQGATYLFSSKSNQKAFKKAPASFAPQYGGFCAYGAAVNALFPVDINTWQVREGRLYLNLNPDILKAFNKDLSKNVTKADKNWPKLAKKHAK